MPKLSRVAFDTPCSYVGYLFGYHVGSLIEDLESEGLLREAPRGGNGRERGATGLSITKLVPWAKYQVVSDTSEALRLHLFAAGDAVCGLHRGWSVATGLSVRAASGSVVVRPAEGGPERVSVSPAFNGCFENLTVNINELDCSVQRGDLVCEFVLLK